MNRRILTATLASLVLLGACSKDTKHKTLHPDTGMIALTTNWDDRTDGVAIPDPYKVSIGSFNASLSGASNEIDHLFTPGAYDIMVYNEAEKITINGTTAAVSALPSGSLELMPGWFFTSHQTLTIEADNDYTVTAPMSQQLRALTLELVPAGDAATQISRITATLTGAASVIDMKSGAVSAAANVDVVFEKKPSGNYETNMRLLGVVGGAYKLTSTIEYTGGNPANTTVESDLTTHLAEFNSNKKAPLALSANVNVPSGVGFTATITDWKEINRDFVSETDPNEYITHHFTDAVFLSKVLTLTTNPRGDGTIMRKDVVGVETVKLIFAGIKSLAGIEFFPALKTLDLTFNSLVSVNLSQNKMLTHLYASDNKLSSIDLSANTNLIYLNLDNNSLAALDVSKNTKLEQIHFNKNKITSLDLSKNTALVQLRGNYNRLSTLDLSKNAALSIVYCSDNLLTTINVDNNKELTYLYCNANKLTELNISASEKMTRLNLVNNPGNSDKEFFVWLPGNMTSTSLPPYFPADLTTWKYPSSGDTDITLHYQFIQDITDKFTDPKFRTYMFQKIGKIEGTDKILIEDVIGVDILNIADLEIESLAGIEYLSGLLSVDCNNNLLTSIDISKNTQLTRLFCSDNQIEKIDLSNNKLLQVIRLNNNKLTTLDVLANTALEVLYVNNNSISSIDVSKITRLANFQCGSNLLTELDVSKNSWLFSLYCDNNAISTLDLSQHKGLTYLLCNNNKIDKLDVSKSGETLKWLQCHTNAGTDDGGVYKFQVDVWTGFDHLTENTFYPNPTNTSPSSGFCGNWQYTPAGGTERTVTVEYKFPVVP